MSETKSDIYTRITNRIVADLEQGVRPWHRPWNAEHAAGKITRPLRHNGIPYKGINVVMLWSASVVNSYACPLWLTFKQALELGGNVKKGERGELVVYADRITRSETDDKGEETERSIPFLKGYTVFNAEQCEGLPAQYYAKAEAPALPLVQRIEEADTFFAATGIDIRHGGTRAYYAEGPDYVQMPPFETFRDAESYAATLGHELIHATKHPKRLARDMGRVKWGDEGYAKEELVVRRVGAIEGVKPCLLGSWDNPCAPDLPVSVMNRQKSRKGNGTIACRDKAQTVEAVVGPAGQHKTRMAKAILPEPQSPGRYPPRRRSDGCNAVPCRCRDATRPGLKRAMRVDALGPASTACPSSRGSKGRTGRLSASHLLNA
jgi:antirestriction protein ArdC